jgi:hypothetical protein
VLSGIVFAAFAAAAFTAEVPSGQQNASSEKPAAPAAPAAEARGAEQSVPPEKPAAAPDAKYSKVAEKNIFYPRHESVVHTGEAGAQVNPGGSSLRLTGVVRAGRKMFAVIENTGTGESSIVTRGESTGAGEVVEAALDGITLSSESGSFKIPVGYFLSGAKGPEILPGGSPSEATSNRQAAGAEAPATGDRQGAAGANAEKPAAPEGPAAADGGRRFNMGGGRRRPSQEQMDAFNNMTPEERQRMRDSMRQGRGRRPDNGEAKQ